jgi:hypothetical protein
MWYDLVVLPKGYQIIKENVPSFVMNVKDTKLSISKRTKKYQMLIMENCKILSWKQMVSSTL